MKKIYSLSILLIVLAINVSAQQVPQFSQYMFNRYVINPAAAGSQSDMPILLGYRSQWSGLTDAPTTFNLSAHTPFGKKVGLGAMFYNDRTGPTSRSELNLSYAYHMRVGFYDLKLAFGLSGVLHQNMVNYGLLTFDLPDDKVLGNSEKSITPNAAFGTYLYNKNFFLGYSLPQLLELKMGDATNTVFENKMLRHNFITAGYKFNIAEGYALEPSFLIKGAKNAPTQVDINTKLIYKESMWLGISGRTSNSLESIVAMVGISKNKISVGYSYDITLSSIRTYAAGSHEFFLGINLNKITRKQDTPPDLGPTPVEEATPAEQQPQEENKKPEEEETIEEDDLEDE